MYIAVKRFRFCVILLLVVEILSFPSFVFATNLDLLDKKTEQRLPANDKFYDEQWYLDKINITDAWKITTGSSGVIVAVIDSGVDIDHPDLQDNVWVNEGEIPDDGIDNDRNNYIDDVHGWDFIGNLNDPNPKIFKEKDFSKEGLNHGTIVAGIIAATGNNNIGISGISWHSKIMPLRVLNSRGVGDISDVVEAINYAINNKANIINLSFVGNKNDPRLEEVLKKAIKKGIIVVSTAGNEGFKGFDNQFLAYKKEYLGGVNVASGNVDGDKKREIITGPVKDSPPLVSIFDAQGNVKNRFFAYNSSFRGGVNIAVGDVDGNNTDEIITGSGFGGGPQVRIFDYDGQIKGQFFAGEEKNRSGVNVATGDVDGDGVDEIITGAGFSGLPEVRIFDHHGKFKGYFFAYAKNFHGGVKVSSGDVDGDGVDEIITGAGFSGGPHVKIFDKNGKIKGQFFAEDKSFRGGINVATGDIDGDGVDEIVTGGGINGEPVVKVFDKNGKLKNDFFAYDQDFRGGVNVSTGNILSEDSSEILTGMNSGGASYVRIKTLSKRKTGINLNKFSLYPTCYQKEIPDLISVISSDVNDEKSVFSNYGDECVNFAAPGEYFFGLTFKYFNKENYGGYWSGTSLATPVVSGTIALMKSIKKDLSPQETIEILSQSVKSGNFKDGEVFYGLIDATKAIKITKEKLNNKILK